MTNISALIPEEGYLRSKLPTAKKARGQVIRLCLILFAVAIGAFILFYYLFDREKKGVFLVVGSAIAVILIAIALLRSIAIMRSVKDIRRTAFFKSLAKEYSLEDEKDFDRLDQEVTASLKNACLYYHMAEGYCHGLAITDKFVILRYADALPDILLRNQTLLLTNGVRVVQTSRYTSTTYYTLNFYTVNKKYTMDMMNELDQQESGMDAAIIIGGLYCPEDAELYKIYRKDRESFIAQITEQIRLLHQTFPSVPV